jgi:hypothetical protein
MKGETQPRYELLDGYIRLMNIWDVNGPGTIFLSHVCSSAFVLYRTVPYSLGMECMDGAINLSDEIHFFVSTARIACQIL